MVALNLLDIPFQLAAAHRTGSSYTCDPPVLDTDEDWLLLTEHDLLDTLTSLLNLGWVDCATTDKELYNEDKYGVTWYAVRKGKYNLIVTTSFDWFMRGVAATLLCKAMNLQQKQQRIRLFRCIRDGEDFTPDFNTGLLRPIGWDRVP